MRIGEVKLETVYSFPYLGHHFQADGDALHAVEVRPEESSRVGRRELLMAKLDRTYRVLAKTQKLLKAPARDY